MPVAALNVCARLQDELLQICGIPQILHQVLFIRADYLVVLAIDAKAKFAVIVL